MSVDKFGRHINGKQCLRGPKGEGFDFTSDGNFDIRNKKLCNVANASNATDCVNLQTLQTSVEICLQSFDKVSKPINTTVEHLKNYSLTINEKNEIDAKHAIIINLSKPKHWYDAVHYKFFQETLADMTYAIYSQINKNKKKKTKKEWSNSIVRIHPADWNELFIVKEESTDDKSVVNEPPNSVK